MRIKDIYDSLGKSRFRVRNTYTNEDILVTGLKYVSYGEDEVSCWFSAVLLDREFGPCQQNGMYDSWTLISSEGEINAFHILPSEALISILKESYK